MTSSIIGIDATTKQRVEIPKPSRLRGLYIIGAPGTGKSGLIENLIIQDIEQDIGVCLLDPHGDLTYAVLARLPDRRVNDVILFDIANYHYPFGLNLFACSDITNPLEVQRTVDQVMHIFEKLFAVSRDTPLILEYLQNCTHTLIVNPGYTMADIPLLFLNEQCRRKLVANVMDTDVRLFWQQYEDKKPSERSEEASSTLRRVREFLQPLSRAIVGQALSTLEMRFIMDERKILLVKLDPRLEMVTSLVGSVIIALFLNAAYSRAELPLEKRKQFNLYADEFQRFATEDFAILFTEARKFGIALTVAHQMREQLDRQNRSATVNVANLVVFKVSSPDADELAGEFDCTPPPAELRREETLTPVSNPFDWLVSGHTHTNPAVNRFVDTHLRKIHTALSSDYAKDIRAELNSFLHRAMTSDDPLRLLTEKSCISLLLQLNYWYPFSPFYFGQTVGASYNEETTDSVTVAQYSVSFYHPIGFEPTKPLEMRHVNQPSLLLKLKNPEPDKEMDAAFAALILSLKEHSFTEAANHFAMLVQAKLAARIEQYLFRYQGFYRENYHHWPYISKFDLFRPAYGYSFKDGHFFRPEEEAKRCSELPERIIADERQAFETFIKEFRDFVVALAKEPIASGSGIYENVPGIQRTFADMQNEIASKIVKLDQYMARVKIAADNTTFEHIIQTLNPKKESRFADTALKTRITAIQEQNIQDGYVTERTQVEEEIRRRQEQCSQLPLLREPIQPPDEPPGSPRRKKIT